MTRVLPLLVCFFSLPAVADGDDRSIQFAGMTWNVRDGHGGPGPEPLVGEHQERLGR